MKFSNIKTWGASKWHILKQTAIAWWELDPFRQSAIIAYYAVFSLPALLVIIITVAGVAFGAEAVNAKVLGQVSDTMGAETAEQVKVMLEAASKTKASGWATIIGVVTLLLGSMGVFLELQKSLNIVWGVEAAPHKGVWGFLRARLFSFGLILSIAFLLIISLVISTVLSGLSDLLRADSSQFWMWVFQVINFILSLSVISLLFSIMFKYLPDAKVPWKRVWIGGLVTGMLFTIGKSALGLYFGKADPGSGYGAAGSIILILLWVSYSSMILFFGAEFTHTYTDMREGVKPSETGKPLEVDKSHL